MAGEFDAGAVVGQMVLAHKEMDKALGQIKKDFKKSGKDMEKSVDKVDSRWDKLKKNIATLGLVAVGYKIARFVSEAVSQFAKLAQSTKAVDNLLREYGKSWDEVYEEMKAASGGMISEMELLTQTGMGLSLGLDPETLVKMMEIARSTAQAMGKDVSVMFESLVTGTARQSKLWLDNLGIIIDTEEAYKEYAKTVKKSVDQLSDFERRQAFTNAVLEKGEVLMRRIGREGTTLAEVIQMGSTAWTDMKTSIGGIIAMKGGLGDTLGFWIGRMRDLTTMTREWVNAWNARPITKELVKLGDELFRETARIEAMERKRQKEIETGKPKVRIALGILPDYDEEIKKAKNNVVVLKGLIKADQSKAAELRKLREEAAETKKPKGVDVRDEKAESEAERRREDALREIEALKEQFMAEDDLIVKHHEDRMEMFAEADLTNNEMKNARILSEQLAFEELDRLRQEDVEKQRRANQEEFDIRKRSTDAMIAANEAKKKAREADIAAYSKSARLFLQIAIGETKLYSGIMAGLEAAEGIKEMGKFLGTKDPSHLASSLQHFLAVKQYLKAAKGAAGGGGGGGGAMSAGGAGAGGGRGGAGARAGAGAVAEGLIREEDRKPAGPPLSLQVNFHGAVLDDDKLQEWMVNNFSPQVEKLVNAGRLSTTWSKA